MSDGRCPNIIPESGISVNDIYVIDNQATFQLAESVVRLEDKLCAAQEQIAALTRRAEVAERAIELTPVLAQEDSIEPCGQCESGNCEYCFIAMVYAIAEAESEGE